MMKSKWLSVIFMLALLLALPGCSDDDDDDTDDDDDDNNDDDDNDTVTDDDDDSDVSAKVDSWAYQLQNTGDLAELAATDYDVAVIDYSKDGSDDGAYSKNEIDALKISGNGKIILSYMSIGEAEDYRSYWQSDWQNNPPTWLDDENPEWGGNYKVKYWEQGWKDIIYGFDDSYLDKIIAAGFDGVYLDIIDASYYYEEQGRETAIDEMRDFVAEIANYARTEKGKSDFWIIPQNAPDLVEDNSGYLGVISGIGVEDTWFNDNDVQDSEETQYALPFLRTIRDAGKPVFVVDYVTENETRKQFCDFALDEQFIPYFGPRDLDELTKYCPCR